MKGHYLEYGTAHVIEQEYAATCVYCGAAVVFGIALQRERFALGVIDDGERVYAHVKCCRNSGLFSGFADGNPANSDFDSLSTIKTADVPLAAPWTAEDNY